MATEFPRGAHLDVGLAARLVTQRAAAAQLGGRLSRVFENVAIIRTLSRSKYTDECYAAAIAEETFCITPLPPWTVKKTRAMLSTLNRQGIIGYAGASKGIGSYSRVTICPTCITGRRPDCWWCHRRPRAPKGALPRIRTAADWGEYAQLPDVVDLLAYHAATGPKAGSAKVSNLGSSKGSNVGDPTEVSTESSTEGATDRRGALPGAVQDLATRSGSSLPGLAERATIAAEVIEHLVGDDDRVAEIVNRLATKAEDHGLAEPDQILRAMAKGKILPTLSEWDYESIWRLRAITPGTLTATVAEVSTKPLKDVALDAAYVIDWALENVDVDLSLVVEKMKERVDDGEQIADGPAYFKKAIENAAGVHVPRRAAA